LPVRLGLERSPRGRRAAERSCDPAHTGLVMSADGPLRIAILTSWFSSEAGYAENCLSKALAAQGHEVHVVTSTAQPYFNDPSYAEIYEPWLGPPLLEPGVTERDGCLVHRLPMRARDNMESIRMRGMVRTLRAIRP